MTAYDYPLANLFGTMLGVFIFMIWFWLLIVIFGDIFRSPDLSGGAKALWSIFVIILPFLGIFTYLLARGSSMHERAERQADQQQKAFDEYVKKAAGSGQGVADDLAKLAELKKDGILTDAEFETQKAKLLG